MDKYNCFSNQFPRWYTVKIELPDGEVQSITTNATSEEIAKKNVLEFYNAPNRAIKEITEFIIPKN